MARLTDVQSSALGYWWNLISDAARGGFTVTETVQIATGVARDQGRTLSPAENRAISSLYGYVRREVNASNAFLAGDANQVINSDMVSIPPYARDEQEMNSYPQYHVKFAYEYIDQAGNRQSAIKTSVFNDISYTTIGELTSEVLSDAEAFAAKYNHTLLSATPIAILAV